MKGTILTCLQKLVEQRKGHDAWLKVLVTAGVDPYRQILAHAFFDEDLTVALFKAAPAILGTTWQGMCDEYGRFWMVSYAPVVYRPMYGEPTAREFFAQLGEKHRRIGKNMPGTTPPEFEFTEINPREGRLTYRSARGLIDLAAGLARGVGDYFGEPLRVTVESPTSLRIAFL